MTSGRVVAADGHPRLWRLTSRQKGHTSPQGACPGLSGGLSFVCLSMHSGPSMRPMFVNGWSMGVLLFPCTLIETDKIRRDQRYTTRFVEGLRVFDSERPTSSSCATGDCAAIWSVCGRFIGVTRGRNILVSSHSAAVTRIAVIVWSYWNNTQRVSC